jgi:hypothetical protein
MRDLRVKYAEMGGRAATPVAVPAVVTPTVAPAPKNP